MVTTITVTTDVPPSREVRIQVPPGVPVGPAQVVLVVLPALPSRRRTLGELAKSEYAGLWSGRDDIQDSVEFASRLRSSAWARDP